MALAVAILYLSSFLPMWNFALAAIAGLLSAAALIECGMAAGVSCYVGCSILGFLLLPEKSGALLYATFFGYYPLVKSAVERRRRIVEWIGKFILFNAVVTVYFFLLRGMLFPEIETTLLGVVPVFFLIANVVFFIYDHGMTKLIALYLSRISIFNRRNGR